LPNGDPIGLSAFPITVRDTDLYDLNVQQNDQASLVMTPAGRVHVAWVTHCIECRYPHPDDCPEPPGNCPEPNDALLIQQLNWGTANSPCYRTDWHGECWIGLMVPGRLAGESAAASEDAVTVSRFVGILTAGERYSRNRDCFALCDGVDCHWRVVRRG
jgi:hypothetical protein